MKWFFKSKDGGPKSNVTGYWLVECKSLFSIVLLRFELGSRENFHDHAFNACSWILKGLLQEETLATRKFLKPSLMPVYTGRFNLHRVFGMKNTSWVLSFRGPWSTYWHEYNKKTGTYTTLTNGRKVVNEQNSSNRQST